VLSLFQFAVVLQQQQQQQQEQQQQQKQQQYQQQQQQQAALDRIFKEAISEEAWPGLLLLVAGMFLVL
jgi:transaldolase